MTRTVKKTAILSAAAIMLGALYLAPAQAGSRDHGDRYTRHDQHRSYQHGYGKPARYYGRPVYHHQYKHHRHHWKHRHHRPYVRYYTYTPSYGYGIRYSEPGYRISIDYGY